MSIKTTKILLGLVSFCIIILLYNFLILSIVGPSLLLFLCILTTLLVILIAYKKLEK